MTPKKMLAVAIVSGLLAAGSPSSAAPAVVDLAGGTPSWATVAVQFVKAHGYVSRTKFKSNRPMTRKAFKKLMDDAFGGGYSETGGKVTAREVDAALVKAVGEADIARHLAGEKSPNGWDPEISDWDGFEIVAREMGLRHDRPTNEEGLESSAQEPMLGADIAYAVWRAKVGPNTWGADELSGFRLDNLKGARAKVVRYAFDQIGLPYIWGGEWAERTPVGYPYGAQAHGGVDCSGFVWYVLRTNASSWQPKKRPYRGWSLADRSSSGMAAGTKKKIGYKKLEPGDIMTFGSGGRKAGASSVYHTGIYLGRGWMIDSSGSQGGVSLSPVGKGSYYRDHFVWGRRVIR